MWSDQRLYWHGIRGSVLALWPPSQLREHFTTGGVHSLQAPASRFNPDPIQDHYTLLLCEHQKGIACLQQTTGHFAMRMHSLPKAHSSI